MRRRSVKRQRAHCNLSILLIDEQEFRTDRTGIDSGKTVVGGSPFHISTGIRFHAQTHIGKRRHVDAARHDSTRHRARQVDVRCPAVVDLRTSFAVISNLANAFF